jgi:hypothetical protein
MKINAAGLLLCTFLVGCGGTAPFGEAEDTSGGSGTGGGTTDDGSGITRDGIPPGTSSPSSSNSIFRTEPRDESNGNGYAQDISYDGDTDTFTVDNLAFDGANVYQRGTAVSSMASYAVYEADQTTEDPENNEDIEQDGYRAIYGVSRDTNGEGVPNTQFAIVRTGSYQNYGFGGFIYQREGDVTLPQSGQARFQGQAGGLRDFNGRGGLEYSSADLTVDIDFSDFNDATGMRGDGVRGRLYNRRVFDINGNDITAAVVGRINTENDASLTAIPEANFVVGPGALDDNGEITGTMTSSYVDNENKVEQYEAGTYYAIVSGDTPDEIVGIMVLENSAEYENATVRETSGFIVYRNP